MQGELVSSCLASVQSAQDSSWGKVPASHRQVSSLQDNVELPVEQQRKLRLLGCSVEAVIVGKEQSYLGFPRLIRQSH